MKRLWSKGASWCPWSAKAMTRRGCSGPLFSGVTVFNDVFMKKSVIMLRNSIEYMLQSRKIRAKLQLIIKIISAESLNHALDRYISRSCKNIPNLSEQFYLSRIKSSLSLGRSGCMDKMTSIPVWWLEKFVRSLYHWLVVIILYHDATVSCLML